MLGIESAWALQQNIVETKEFRHVDSSADMETLPTNAHEKLHSYRDYMNQLAPHEMDLLYEAFANDFNVFGYDPCLDINQS